MAPFRIDPRFDCRLWGYRDLRPWYDHVAEGEPIGEVWLSGDANVVATGPHAGKRLDALFAEAHEALLGTVAPSPASPLLIKVILAKEKLSVQVHPDDKMAQKYGEPRGKTECWYVLEAKPGATIALGLREGATADAVRAAIAAGTLEELLQWVPVQAGDMVFVDAGTVHAIGPGVVFLETQQTCDITFRMYDYGRPRELHVEQALQVMKLETAAGKVKPVAMDGFVRLIAQKYFVVDRYKLDARRAVVIPIAEAGCLVGLRGSGLVECSGAAPVELLRGRAVVTPASAGEVVVRSNAGASFVRCFAPGS